MRNRSRILILVLFVSAAAIAFLLSSDGGRFLGRKPEQTGGKFQSLEEVLAAEMRDRWAVSSQPRSPGPYRRSPEGPTFLGGGNRGEQTISRIRDKSGAVVEELTLNSEAFDQLVVHLDTESGGRTQVVLRRDR